MIFEIVKKYWRDAFKILFFGLLNANILSIALYYIFVGFGVFIGVVYLYLLLTTASVRLCYDYFRFKKLKKELADLRSQQPK